ncbi:ABC transporter substrate-binding protein [Pseudomonas typographi]|uniref:Amino acid ABC transporter substrate-binding protein n=1 Tax=Pseudomonas typographi TaxID=2715964 RepID=A0ABR7Z468_9PSED|nr:ABC transporter substrate-binding protein [Pseudomonas typographi]MBD1552677.1 amino acid ABC transporter substrate-binding protein [Pseudomonas typographi]MBD1588158.1 amino acid ABC transporter substrate-binding protein [Pseudomonas typographi]MBD1600129.1 amino acid ABC transporter substrate-binding protein [Pseudomonas typographi]
MRIRFGITLAIALAMANTAHAVTLGAVLPLSGSSASIGEDQRRGIDMAVADINAKGGLLGAPLAVKIEDSADGATGALDAATKLHSIDKVPVVLGEYSSSVSIPLGQYLVKQGMVHLNIGSSSPAIRQIGASSFSLIGLDDLSAQFAAKDILGLGYRKVAFIAPNGAYGQGIDGQFKKYLQAGGGSVVAEVLYTPGQSSYRRELQQMQRSQPDVYVYSAYGQEAAVINRESFELGISKTPWYGIYLSMCTADTPAQIANGQIGMEVASLGSAGQAFAAEYQKRYGFAMKSSYSSYAYDGVMLAAAAIAQAKSADPAKVIAALDQLGASFAGATGKLALDADRQRTEQPYDKLAYEGGSLHAR